MRGEVRSDPLGNYWAKSIVQIVFLLKFKTGGVISDPPHGIGLTTTKKCTSELTTTKNVASGLTTTRECSIRINDYQKYLLRILHFLVVVNPDALFGSR